MEGFSEVRDLNDCKQEKSPVVDSLQQCYSADAGGCSAAELQEDSQL